MDTLVNFDLKKVPLVYRENRPSSATQKGFGKYSNPYTLSGIQVRLFFMCVRDFNAFLFRSRNSLTNRWP